MTTIEADIDIATAPGEVWGVLTDFGAYGYWNPFITAIEGQPAPGERITVHVVLAGQTTLPIKAEIVTLRPDEELVWRSHLLHEGLFDRDHVIRLEANATGCIVKQQQSFSGPIAPAAALLTEDLVRRGLERMNAALKRRVETTGNN